MHSPPPTPDSRSHGRAARTTNIADLQKDISAPSTISKKRKRDQAGLITPRETPRKSDLLHNARGVSNATAKVLFPSSVRPKFQVFEDPKSPDPFEDDETNPFKAPKKTRTNSGKSVRRFDRLGAVEKCTTIKEEPDELCNVAESSMSHSTRPTMPQKTEDLQTHEDSKTTEISTTSRRKDGMTYVFRGKRVFRKYKTEEDAEEADAVKPKRLFVKELTAPKLSNPFEESGWETDDSTSLALLSHQECQASEAAATSSKLNVPHNSIARQLF